MPKKAANEVNEFDNAAWANAFESMTADRKDEDDNSANVREAAEMVTKILDMMVRAARGETGSGVPGVPR